MIKEFNSELAFFKDNLNNKLISVFDHRYIFVFGGPYRASESNSSPYSQSKKFFSFIKSKVCKSPKIKAFRKEFFEFLKLEDSPQNYCYLYAEEIFDNIKKIDERYKFLNIALIEKVAGHVVDAILIFPESVGSYCEIGYFAHSEELRNKIIVANNEKYLERGSFLKLGIIQLIQRNNLFDGNVIGLSVSGVNSQQFKKILERVQTAFDGKKKNKLFVFENYAGKSIEDKEEWHYRVRFVVWYEIINHFRYISFKNARVAFKEIFEHYETDELEIYTAILLSLGIVVSNDHESTILKPSQVFSFLTKSGLKDLGSRSRDIADMHRKENTIEFQAFNGGLE